MTAVVMMVMVAGRTGDGAWRRPARLNRFLEVVYLACEIFLQSQRHGLGRVRKSASAETRGHGYAQNTA